MKRTHWIRKTILVSTGAIAVGAATGKDEIRNEEDTRIKTEVIVHAPLGEAWDAWTTNDGIQTFFSQYSNVKLEIGGPFEILFDGTTGSNGCEILSFLPREMLSFSWNAPPQFAHARKHPTWVVIQFDRIDDNQTHVRLSHLGWDEQKRRFPDHAEEWDQVREYFAKAWPYVLDNLKKRFENGPRWGSAQSAQSDPRSPR